MQGPLSPTEACFAPIELGGSLGVDELGRQWFPEWVGASAPGGWLRSWSLSSATFHPWPA